MFFFLILLQIIENQYFIGHPPEDLYENETTLLASVVPPRPAALHRVGSFRSGNVPTPSLHIEFTGGKACDIENTLRGATIEIACGIRDGIEDIIEDRTCHYLFKVISSCISLIFSEVYSVALCSVEGFAPPKQNV
jgi:hypothetical protein